MRKHQKPQLSKSQCDPGPPDLQKATAEPQSNGLNPEIKEIYKTLNIVRRLSSPFNVLPLILVLLTRPVAAYTSCAAGFQLSGSDCTPYAVNAPAGTTCSGGQYQQAGSTSSCVTIPDGYLTNSASFPTFRTSGYMVNSDTTSTTQCLKSTNCLLTTTSQVTCNANQETNISGQVAFTDQWNCHTCAAGYTCSGQVATAVSAITGSYTDALGGATTASTCNAGNFCPSTNAADMYACPSGFYIGVSAINCVACPAGSSCSTTAATPCATGEYSLQYEAACRTCPAGFFCASMTVLPVACALGSYSSAGATSCTTCTSGNYCPSPTSSSTACSAGYTSTAPYTACTACSAGYSCAGGAAAVQCAAGFYSFPKATTCTRNSDSGANGDSADRADLGQLCRSGYYSDSGSNGACTQAPVGNYASISFATPVNSYQACSSNQYCPKGTETPTTCPAWLKCDNNAYTICNDGQVLNGVSSGSCVDCPAGMYCTLRSASSQVAVDTGYYSLVGVSVELICPAGYSCSNSGAPVACSDGYYSIEGQLDCTICPLEYACPSREMPLASQINCRNTRGVYQTGTGNTACKWCPAGYYCPWGQVDKTQCPFGSQGVSGGYWSLTASESCNMCPKGYACPQSNMPVMNPCLTGFWSNDAQSTCTACLAGFACVSSTNVACNNLQYSLAGWGQCLYFPAGNYATSSADAGTACPAGTWSMYGDGDWSLSSQISVCKTCPIGHYCPTPKTAPKVCLPGQYQDVTGQTACKNCGVGTYSLFGAIECYQCPPGHWCESSTSKVPRKCRPGSYSNLSATQCTVCTDGLYCAAGISMDFAPLALCAKGMTCKNTPNSWSNVKLIETPCPAGSYNDVEGQSNPSGCNNCNSGYYCPLGAIEQYLCPTGHYCGSQAATPTPCDAGTYNNQYGKNQGTDCLICPSGYQCLAGSTLPQVCPAGKICTGTSTQSSCAVGTYSGSETITSLSQCKACWKGYTCIQDARFPVPCPKGTYNDQLSKSNPTTDCIKCDAGTPCPYTGLAHKDTGLSCAPGYYCPAGTYYSTQFPCDAGYTSGVITYVAQTSCVLAANLCPAGFYCTAGSNPFTNPPIICPIGYYCEAGTASATPTGKVCGAGFYSDIPGLKAISECKICPAGYICAVGATTYITTICPTGNYCVQSEPSATGSKCPDGYQTGSPGLISSSQCTPCPIGSYCTDNAFGVRSATQCPAGTYSNRLHLYALTNVVGGARGCITCPAGYICVNAGTIDPIACQPGFFSIAGQTVCASCPIGSYCDQVAMTASVLCGVGFNCYQANIAYRPQTQDALYSCKPGYWCTGAVSTACLAGTYQPFYGKSLITDCIQTPAGHFTDQQASTSFYQNFCPAGLYCQAGTKSQQVTTTANDGNMKFCPEKYFRSYTMGTALSDCALCPAGYTCGQATINPVICQVGFYCPAGASAPTPCPTGKFGSGPGLSQLTDCSPCYGGRYCLNLGASDITNKCDVSYYCVENSNTPVPQYANVGNNPADSFGNVYPVGNICEAGGYCPTGSKFPLPCPPGYYNPSKQKSAEADCLPCPAGSYCNGAPDLTRTDLPGASAGPPVVATALASFIPRATKTALCKAGYYCTGGAYNEKQFPAQLGYYTLSGSTGCLAGTLILSGTAISCTTPDYLACAAGSYNPFSAQSGCLTCPAGYYCPNTGMTAPTMCPAGAYCQSGRSSTQACPAGTFSTKTYLVQSADCDLCTSGNYCSPTTLTASQGLTAVSGTCTAGYYCNLKATEAAPAYASSTFAYYGICPKFLWSGSAYGSCTPCLPGTLSTTTGMQNAAACGQQIAGYYSRFVSGTLATGAPIQEADKCLEGFYCLAGSKWSSDYTHYCAIGQQCPSGSSVVTNCLAGTWQPNPLQPTCYTCPAGYFCDVPGTIGYDLSNYLCPAGYFCPAGTTSGTAYPCPWGTYNDHTGAKDANSCVPSPPGFYQPTPAATTLDTTKTCTAGYYCKMGSWTATPVGGYTAVTVSGVAQIIDIGGPCTAGNYCPAGAPQQIPCTPGKTCTIGQLALPNTDCGAGYYCIAGTGNSLGTVCNAGYYCPVRSGEPTPCPAGTYSSATGKTQLSDCILCTQGYYCSNLAQTSVDTASNKCIAGFYCPTGSKYGKPNICTEGNKCPTQSYQMTACTNTATGEYQDEKGAADCKQCQAGFECTQTTSTKCKPQSAGPSFYCPGMTQLARVNCAAGTYNVQDQSSSVNDCWPCPKGFMCPLITDPAVAAIQKAQLCTQGYYCTGSGAAGTICPIGFYCPLGSNIPIPCDAGFACTSQGQYVPQSPCLAGNYCSQTTDNTIITTLCINEATATCIKGATSTTGATCPTGSYCSANSFRPYPCPIGTYQPYTGKSLASDCIQCTAGQYCYNRGLTAPQAPCLAGYYCPAGSDQLDAQTCPAGSSCVAGSAAPVLCVPGTYQPNEAQASCKDCQAGTFCSQSGMLLPEICPTGSYCDVVRMTTTNLCPEGTFSDKEGLYLASQCQACTFGKYCVGTGLISANQGTSCTALSYCLVPGIVSGALLGTAQLIACTAGQICPAGTIFPTLCAPGTYSSSAFPTATSSCISCPVNKYCPDWGITTATLQSCPDGYLCLGGAIYPSNLDNVTIKLCPAGSYCAQANCAAGVTNCNPQVLCAVNYFNPREGQSACQPCIAGFDCTGSTGLVQPNPCPRGSYCPAYVLASGIANVVPCPAGTYSSNLYLTAASQCTPCPPGRYCVAGSSSFTGFCTAGYVCTQGQSSPTPTGTFDYLDYAAPKSGPCPVGNYCPFGSSYPIPCVSGTYQPLTGQMSCIACDKYRYCPTSGLSAPGPTCDDGYVCFSAAVFAQPFDYITGRICSVGNYCSGGQEQQCKGGTYAPIEGLASCLTCPPGYYCNDSKGTIEPKICPTYYFCPSETTTPFSCPNGTYTNPTQTGLESDSQCASCPTGFYCINGKFDRTNVCGAGYYCDSGAMNQTQTNKTCPGGYYCLAGTPVPTACPEGKYSLPGAKSEDSCGLCLAGYYCVRYVSSSIMQTCPTGYFCPAGLTEPSACPKGTYNANTKSKSYEDCKTCPAGTACDETGIGTFQNFLCPPGYFCPENSYIAKACDAGTFRPQQGAIEGTPVTYTLNGYVAACFTCVPGYYCSKKATVIPDVCPPGSYCPSGAIQPIDCMPGFYCPGASGAMVICPRGYYCPSRSDTYLKCPFGTYCEDGSSQPTPCPDGTYGSGTLDNFDERSGCKDCGRGLYSTKVVPDVCLDCTPGYVCYGRTNSRLPAVKAINNGEPCPVGHYCPGATYDPTECPIGRYAKQTGTTSADTCLKCKNGYYNDVPGQPGCKKCGPTSTSFGGATTCVCNGANRDFVKTGGQCLCTTGYKPKDNLPNIDSNADCELISKQGCAGNEDVNSTGYCVNATVSADICSKQCGGQPGKLVAGTGLCQCSSITDPSQVCDTTCQKTSPISTLNSNGQLSVYDPVTKKTSTVDPSTIPGYYGDFACQSQSGSTGCRVFYMGMTTAGDFSYDYSTPSSVLNAVKVPDNTNKSKLKTKLVSSLKANTTRAPLVRNLQADVGTSQRLYNPVICIQEGGVIFFNVDAGSLAYPRYFKDSILNTNPSFDYGPFQKLETMIVQQGTPVETFSFIFKDQGIYVFESAASGTVTIIGVVDKSQTCSNSVNGIGAAMVTDKSLAQIGIESQDKKEQPNWWFINFSFFCINVFVFLVIGIMIRAHNLKVKGQSNIFAEDETKSSIYYDKLVEMQKSKKNRLCCKKSVKIDQKPDTVPTEPEEPKHEYAIRYEDLESLLQKFNEAQAVLKKQLIDREKREREMNKQFDDEGNLVKPLTEEDELLKEMMELLDFTRKNRECLDKAIGKNKKEPVEKIATQETDIVQKFQNQLANKIASHLKSMIETNIKTEEAYQTKIQDKVTTMQKERFENNLNANDEMKHRIQEEYQKRIGSGELSDNEKEALLQELQAKLANINELMEEEQDAQNGTLQDLLARRKAKKEKLQGVLNNLSEKKMIEDERYSKKISEVNQTVVSQREAVDLEIEDARREGLQQIEQTVQQKRLKILSEQEKRLQEFRNKTHGNPESDFAFNDMLAEYGNLVKKVDADLKNEKERQTISLEEKLKKRKQDRIRELQDQAKDKEDSLNSQNLSTKKELNDEIKQIQSLLKPVQNETDKMKIILQNQQVEDGLLKNTPYDLESQLKETDVKVAAELSKVSQEEKAVAQCLRQIENENEVKRREIEKQREMIKKSIEGALNEDERQRLMKQMEQFEKTLKDQLALEADAQNTKLKAAIEARRNKRKKVLDGAALQKQALILDQFKASANSNVRGNVDKANAKDLADRIHNAFGKDDSVQVTENFIDQKQQQELLDLMNNLFEEKAKALRRYILELALEKQQQLDDLKGEMEPQKEFLRQKKVKNLITPVEFQAGLDRLTQEETERAQDIEIAFNDREKELKEQIDHVKIDAESEQKKLLKDRQTQEKMVMFSALMKNMDEKDQMKQYLDKALRDSEKELEQFRRKADKDKAHKREMLEEAKKAKMIELQDRQQRMYSWEEQQKRDENQHMEQFRRQKEEIMARKLADQQRDLLKDMNQNDVDMLLNKHKKELQTMDDVLQEEQQRQMERMRERMKGRNVNKNKDAVLRQIKLAEIKKTQQEQLEKAKVYEAAANNDVNTNAVGEAVQRCVEKAGLMQKLCQKQCYSRQIYFKRHIQNQQKLNLFLGRGIIADWESSKGAIDEISEMSDLSMNTAQLKETINQEEKITYKTLLEHIENADKNYEQMRPRKEKAPTQLKANMSTSSRF